MSNVSDCLEQAGYDRLIDKLVNENTVHKNHMQGCMSNIRQHLDALEEGLSGNSGTPSTGDFQVLADDLIRSIIKYRHTERFLKELRFLHSAVSDVEISTEEILTRR